MLLVGLTILALTCARGRYESGRYHPLEAGSLSAVGVIRGDPEPVGAGWRAEVRLTSGERLQATAFGRAGFELRARAVGDRVTVRGRLRPLGDRPWLRARHVVGRLAVDEIVLVAPAAGFDRVVNEMRAVIIDGARSYDDRGRSLYTGLVIGDDRFQPLAQQAQFRASGLTHLLAVSGQNVAFVLLVVRPLVMVFGRRTRLLAILVVIVVFAAMTRAEPSVLRASSAAGVATWALLTGRTGSGVRTLAVAVTGLLVVDPFLLDVVGFQLSVAASAGIIVMSPLVLRRLATMRAAIPGSTLLTQAVAVTIGAQVGVAPLLVHYFGPLPLASIPANLAAGWAAGAVMTLGLTLGPISGLLERARLPAAAGHLQWPSRTLVGWIDGTARWSADLDLPRLGAVALATLVLLGVIAAVRPRRCRPDRVVGGVVLVAVVLVMAGARGVSPDRPVSIASGVIHLPSGEGNRRTASVLVVADPSPAALDAVLASRVNRVDIIVTERGDSRAATIVGALAELIDTAVILAPPQHRIRGATRITEPTTVETEWGPVSVRPDSSSSRLTIDLPAGTGLTDPGG